MTNHSPFARYEAMIAAGDLRADGDQYALVLALQLLHEELALASLNSVFSFAWLRKFLPASAQAQHRPRGIYLWGGVGRGKSMLMDMFYDCAPVRRKSRRHFHEFMLDVHARLAQWRGYSPAERVAAGGKADAADPIAEVAREVAEEAHLLCFDELQVSDIADAMILGRLFAALFERGVVVVATSNRPPQDLYKDGLNRQLFLPFIALLTERLNVMSLNGPTDYRRDRLGDADVYLTPVDEVSTAALSATFFRLTDRDIAERGSVPSETLQVQGRALFVPKAARGVAVFSFKRLCGEARGAADFLAIARRYHTVIMVAIPVMGPHMRNEAKRFVTFIDALYEHNVKFLCSAEGPPETLYKGGSGAFEFERTISRLLEMQSEAYLASGHCSRIAGVGDKSISKLEEKSA